MDYEIVWLNQSLDDLEEIHEYIATDNPTAAAKLIRGIQTQVELLCGVPGLGPRYRCPLSGEIRQIVFGNYRIFYEVHREEHRVEILRVWHSSRQEPEL